VRRFAKQRCWPWLLDRLIEREVQARKAVIADEANLPQAAPATHARLAPDPAEIARTMFADQMLWMPEGGWADDLLLYHVTPALPQPAEEWGRSEDDVKRRTFLLGVPAAFLFSRARLWQPLWSRLEAATLDVGALDELAAAVARDSRLHDRLGSHVVQGLVTEHLRLATELLGRSPPLPLRARLAAIATEAAVEAGLVCCDQRWFSASRSYYRLASELAKEAGDPHLGAFALGSFSSNLLTEVGDRTGAVSLLGAARTLAARGGSPITEAYIAAAEAEAQAKLGDADAALQALDQVDRALDRSEGGKDLSWLYWFDPGVRAGWKGQSYLRLGRLGDAETLLASALSSWDPSFVRDRAITLVDLASVRLRQTEIDECCRLAGEALEVSIATASPRLVQRVRGLRGELQPWSGSSGVKVLDEQLATAVWV
jgi:tetratricopeptide (TPR) repeat protein